MFDNIEKLALPNVYKTETEVFAYQCPSCNQLHYPAVLRCKKCGYRRYPEDELELIWHKKGYQSWIKVPLQGSCKLLSFTRLWALPVGFEQRYLDFGLVEFENGLRAVGHLDVAQPQLGMSLKATTRKIRELRGEDFYGLVFVP